MLIVFVVSYYLWSNLEVWWNIQYETLYCSSGWTLKGISRFIPQLLVHILCHVPAWIIFQLFVYQ